MKDLLSIGKVAELFGISVRALRFYDENGLLSPSSVSEAGYRYYDRAALSRLQQILFYRELELPLSEIKRILSSPDYREAEALTRQRELLLAKQRHLDGLLLLLNDALKGENTMSNNKSNKSYSELKAIYKDEVKARWGNTSAYAENEAKESKRSSSDNDEVMRGANEIFDRFAEIRTEAPESIEAQELVKVWQDFITANYYTCTKEILAGLGEMYSGDERFKENIDKSGDGTADFMTRAIRIYCA